MKSEESISKMFTRFTNIINSLKSLGKCYTNVENVRKILRYLPKHWDAKVTTIEEAKDLTKMSLDELLGSLMTHEILLKGWEEEAKPKRSLTLKSSHHESEEEEESDGDKETTLLTKQFKSLWERRKITSIIRKRFLRANQAKRILQLALSVTSLDTINQIVLALRKKERNSKENPRRWLGMIQKEANQNKRRATMRWLTFASWQKKMR